MALFALFLTINSVFAADSNVISSAGGSGDDMQVVLCNVLAFVIGGIGKTIASFIIIGVGLRFFAGKVSYGVFD